MTKQLDYAEIFEQCEMIPLFTVYDHPTDFPDHYVVRVFDGDRPTSLYRVAETLEDVRAFLPDDVCRLERRPEDDPRILEVWV